MSIDLKQKILGYDRQVPRYTSYPTAPHFKEGMAVTAYQEWLSALPDYARLSLYVHVPFCPRMCWYCGCHTKITQRYDPVESYAQLLRREIALLAPYIKPTQRVTHIHFGGGSPSMLKPDDFRLIIETIKAQFSFAPDAEIAMEVDPRGVTSEHVRAYVAAGLNRVSLGVQDFNQRVLEAVNRPQPYELSRDVVAMFRAEGVHHINFDFLYGLPYQTVDTMRATMQQAIDLHPSRISLFGYAHVPWMKKHMQLIDADRLPSNSERYDMFETASVLLQQHEYVPIGIDHFAKSDDALVKAQKNKTLRRNFQGYTTDTADVLIGIGSSSIGKLSQGFVQNSPHMPIYREMVLNGVLPVAKSCVMSDEDHVRSDIIEQLMAQFSVDIEVMCKRYGLSLDYFDQDILGLQPYIRDGLVSIDPQRVITINPQAPQIVRLVAAVFDAYLPAVSTEQAPRHSRAI